MHACGDRRLIVSQLGVVRKVPAKLPEHPQHAADHQQRADDGQSREIS
jgi:hypothetical protein